MQYQNEEQLSGKAILVVAIATALLLAPIGLYFQENVSRENERARRKEYFDLQAKQTAGKARDPKQPIAEIAQGQSGPADLLGTASKPSFDRIWMVAPASGIGGNNVTPMNWNFTADGTISIPENQPPGLYHAYYAHGPGDADLYEEYEFKVVLRHEPLPLKGKAALAGKKITAR